MRKLSSKEDEMFGRYADLSTVPGAEGEMPISGWDEGKDKEVSYLFFLKLPLDF